MDRDALRRKLATFGIERARRATTADPTEEIILLDPVDFERIDATEVTLALMTALPHRKVWVVADTPSWESEPL